jgi:hypothetical protein
VVKNHEGGTRMGIGVPISKVVPGKANQRKAMQQRRKAAVQSLEQAEWSSVPASHGAMREAPLRRRSGAEGGAKRQPRSTRDLWSNAATRSDGTKGAPGKRRARRGDDVTRQRGATRKRRAAGSRTLRLCTMEGRSLDNPTRGNPALRPGRKDRNASGKPASRSGGSRESERK